MWNHHASEGPRTNNSVEGWHSKLSKVSARNHPNLYEVIKLFKREQASVEVKVARLTAGGRAPQMRRAAIKMDERIREMKRRLDEGECSIDEYLTAIGRFTGL